MKKPNDYRQDYQQYAKKRTNNKPLQTFDTIANICAYIILLSGLISFFTGLFYGLKTSTLTGILPFFLYLVVSILIFTLTQMIRAVFKKIVWEQ